MTSKQITFRGQEFGSANEAIQHTHASGRGEAIAVGGKYLVVEQAEARRMEVAGVAFAYLHVIDHQDHPHGLLVTVPVN
ncbi:MAG: hypothetical protein AMXMBFR77_27010 [Phycisphaerales bacterium]